MQHGDVGRRYELNLGTNAVCSYSPIILKEMQLTDMIHRILRIRIYRQIMRSAIK